MMLKTLSVMGLLAVGFAPAADALPFSKAETSGSGFIPIFDGCGPLGHRGPAGLCRPGGQGGGYIRGESCPAGWHIEPHGRYCLLNRGPVLGPSSGGVY